jgi:hypothetical protein
MIKPVYQKLKTEQKALEINLNDKIYGTFSEIGAGQEVARNFFKAGAAAGSIAKTMSAYDKTYSDTIYGPEKSGRYVCESRLYNMLEHEWKLLEERLDKERPDTNFFVFADTVTTINYSKTFKGQGWIGVRFQSSPNSEPNEVVIHCKMHDNDTQTQQDAVGILGVNLLYGCQTYREDVKLMIASLMDGLEGRVSIDLIRFKGDGFEKIDNKLVSLYMVGFGLTDVTIFDEEGTSIHASEFLYKKSLMVVRGNFKPPTLVTQDVISSGYKQFQNEPDVDPERTHLLTEMTLDYLKRKQGTIKEEDFLMRADLLKSLGYKVLISNHNNHQDLINYMADQKIQHLGLVLGVRELRDIIKDKFENNQDGRLLVSLGELFNKNIKIYAYPGYNDQTQEMTTAHNLPVPEGMKYLYKHLLNSEQIVEIVDYNKDNLDIYPNDVVKKIQDGDTSWYDMVPDKVKKVIIENNYFKQ